MSGWLFRCAMGLDPLRDRAIRSLQHNCVHAYMHSIRMNSVLQVRMEGPDVAEERRRVEGLGRGDAETAIVLRDLCKVYPAEVRPMMRCPSPEIMSRARLCSLRSIC